MLDFQPIKLDNKSQYEQYLFACQNRGCEYSFTNLWLWGRQQACIYENHFLVFSQFNRQSIYLFPVGQGPILPVLEAIIEDARQRGIPCRLTGLLDSDKETLEQLFPGQFHYHHDRDSFDYIYAISDLATLKGKRFQKKRNHLNRFYATYPDATLSPITDENTDRVLAMVEAWFTLRLQEDPFGDFEMERVAIDKALKNREKLGLEGLILENGGQILAMSLGSRLNENTFDIHFEKALDFADGAYAAINRGFAAHLMEKYPDLLWLNREDDLGLPGLRKAKESYNPSHMIEKNWACLREDGYAY